MALATDSSAFAGTERHMLHLATALRAEGVDAKLLCPAAGALGQAAQGAGISVLDWRQDRGPWSSLTQLVDWLQAGRIDLLHAHNGRTSLCAGVAIALTGRGRLIATQHFLHPARTNRQGVTAFIANTLHRWLEGRTGRIIAVSVAVCDQMLLRGTPAGKVRVVLNGIESPPTVGAEARDALRAKLGIPMESPLVVTAARLESEKGIGHLVDAFVEVVRSIPAACCIIAGEGAEMGELQRRIATAEIGGAIRLLGFRSDVLQLIAAGDLFVLPSPAEPFGLAIVEAMGLGKAVVACDAGGPPEIVVSGETGLLVRPGDSKALAKALIALLRDPERREEMGARGAARFHSHFTAAQMAKETVAVYAELS